MNRNPNRMAKLHIKKNSNGKYRISKTAHQKLFSVIGDIYTYMSNL